MIVSIAVSAVLQLALFSAIPFLVWYVSNRRSGRFAHFVGLHRPRTQTLRLALMIAVPTAILAIILFSLPQVRSAAVPAGSLFHQLAAADATAYALVAVVIYSVFQTALAEEILFRGFIAKLLIRHLGYGLGNLAQAALFGAVHVILFTLLLADGLSTAWTLTIATVAGSMGWLFGQLNEKWGNGSIVPGWIVHSVANLSSYGAVVLAA